MSITTITSIPLTPGKELQAIDAIATEAGVQSVKFAIDSETILVSLYVESVAGDLDVVVETYGKDIGEAIPVIAFPTISAPTTSLILKKASAAMQHIRVTATYTDACTFNVRVRGISGGATDVKILGAGNAVATNAVITTTPAVIVPVSLTDRTGVVVKNNNASGILYLGFSLAEATLSTGYPIGPKEALALDVASGVAVYGVSDSVNIDIRLLEAGA